MRSMLSAFPTETLILHKKDGTTVSVTALVDRNTIHMTLVTFRWNLHFSLSMRQLVMDRS